MERRLGGMSLALWCRSKCKRVALCVSESCVVCEREKGDASPAVSMRKSASRGGVRVSEISFGNGATPSDIFSTFSPISRVYRPQDETLHKNQYL